MKASTFFIYNASAGAGKTFQLVRNYLRLCLRGEDPMAFRQILAITFTNKAAQEMKRRIVAQMLELAAYPQGSSKAREYSQALAEELGISPEKLALRAQASVKSVLHNYSAFSVSTIDKFTNRLIRSFSRDLELSSNYQVVLDSQEMLDESIDAMLSQLREGEALQRLLTRFIEAQLAEERSSNTRIILRQSARQLFVEEAQSQVALLKDWEPADFIRVEKEISGACARFEAEAQKQAQDLLDWCAERQIDEACFSRKTVWSDLQRQARGEFCLFTASAIGKITTGGPFHAKGKAKQAQSIIAHEGEFAERVAALWRFWEEHYPLYWMRKNLLQKLPAAAVLKAIDHELQILKKESQRLPIGEFNKIISASLREQPAPFIYEKLGERYRHFFIDEFQDTSQLQWENLVPLINNAMAGEHSSAMVVGDPKQSIYRFRGGKVQLFIDLYENREPSNRGPGGELYPRQVVPMGQNWRSRATIVDFNNRFFGESCAVLPQPEHQELYHQGYQEAKGKTGGLVAVHLSALESSAYREEQGQLILNIVEEALARGFRQKDIGILCNKNEDGRYLARFLLENSEQINLPAGQSLRVVSVDSLVLSASAEVMGLMSFLQLLQQPLDYQARLPWLQLAHRLFAPEQERHQFMSEQGRATLKESIAFLEKACPAWRYREWEALRLLEKCYALMKAWALDWQNDPYLQGLLDWIEDFEKNQEPSLQLMLQEWQKKGQNKSLPLPADLDALQLMTIHKSKGLEFPVLIYAFANPSIGRELISDKEGWLPLNPESFAGLPTAYLQRKSFNSPSENPYEREMIKQHFPEYHAWTTHEEEQAFLDALNKAYVAFTRAEDELYILSQWQKDSKNKKQSLTTTLGRLLKTFCLAEEAGWYREGEAIAHRSPAPAGSALFPIDSFSPLPWAAQLKVVSQAPADWGQSEQNTGRGQRIHQLLSRIYQERDLDPVLAEAQARGDLMEGEAEALRPLLEKLLQTPPLAPLFGPRAHSLTERGLLSSGGKMRIPDRLTWYEEELYLIDYKTGLAKPEHQKQVREYRQLLQAAGEKLAASYLVYLGEETFRIEEVA